MSPSARTLPALLAWLVLAASLAAQPLPGQIVVDPDYPQSFLRHGTDQHVWICGPGDPEDFLYRGTRLPDGTRDGDQVALIQKLIDHGGNSIYFETVRSNGGDGPADHNPFVNFDGDQGWIPEILDQWETWFTLMDAHDILIYLFIFDDGAKPWSTGNQVLAPEQAYVEEIVNRFEHHRNIIFLVAEESEESMSDSKARTLAQIMADANDHDHLIGNHHHVNTFLESWVEGTALNHYGMHNGNDPHQRAIEARHNAEVVYENAYQALYAENNSLNGASAEERRRYIWDAALGGIMPMITHMKIADTAIEELAMLRTQQRFMEQLDFWTMRSHDERAHGATQWVLARDEGSASQVLYAEDPQGDLGLAGMDAGTYLLSWVDCVTGATELQTNVVLAAGDHTFPRPASIGPWHAVWVRRTWDDLGGGVGAPGAQPVMYGMGDLTSADPSSLHMSGGPDLPFGWLVMGASILNAPFKGGVLVPDPGFLLNVFLVDGGLGFPLPSLPPGTGGSLTMQCWIQDPAAPSGWAGSNGVTVSLP